MLLVPYPKPVFPASVSPRTPHLCHHFVHWTFKIPTNTWTAPKASFTLFSFSRAWSATFTCFLHETQVQLQSQVIDWDLSQTSWTSPLPFIPDVNFNLNSPTWQKPALHAFKISCTAGILHCDSKSLPVLNKMHRFLLSLIPKLIWKHRRSRIRRILYAGKEKLEVSQ